MTFHRARAPRRVGARDRRWGQLSSVGIEVTSLTLPSTRSRNRYRCCSRRRSPWPSWRPCESTIFRPATVLNLERIACLDDARLGRVVPRPERCKPKRRQQRDRRDLWLGG